MPFEIPGSTCGKMKYCSTRGGFRGLSFQEALFSGFTSDGGFLLPESIPRLDAACLKAWAALSYPNLVKHIVSLFVSRDEIPSADLNGILDAAFAQFSIPEVVKVSRLPEGLNILEMFHGKTMAFKDLAMSCVGQFISYFLTKKQKHVTILVGTSGDTGSAAIEGVRGLDSVDIVVLLPRGRCSKVQELQMTTAVADNIHIYRVDGTSDDLDAPIKSCFMDKEFVQRHNVISINSINWSRIMVQIAHYFYSYLQLCPSCDSCVEIVVPTGGLGNCTAGVIAHQMGLPIKIVCAVNRNDIVARTMKNGDFSMRDVVPSLAPAMDIQVPYNMERLLFLFTDGDAKRVSTIMSNMEENGGVTIPEDIMKKLNQVIIGGHTVSDDDIKSTMKKIYQDSGYLLCPHTATAVNYHLQHSDENTLRMCLATASAAKFEEAMRAAGITSQPLASISALYQLPTKFQDLEKQDNWEAVVRAKIEEITNKVHAHN